MNDENDKMNGYFVELFPITRRILFFLIIWALAFYQQMYLPH